MNRETATINIVLPIFPMRTFRNEFLKNLITITFPFYIAFTILLASGPDVIKATTRRIAYPTPCQIIPVNEVAVVALYFTTLP